MYCEVCKFDVNLITLKRILTTLLFLTPLALVAQTHFTNAGWFTLSNSTELTKSFSVFADLQLRTTNRWIFLRQVEFSGGVNYKLADKNEIGIGGVLTNTRAGNAEHLRENDRRILEQYIVKHVIGLVFASHRFRLEQRFIDKTTESFFTQRFRYRFRLQKSLSRNASGGYYTTLQNEVLLNVQNKKRLTGHVFDQNRLLLAGGYRVSEKLDLELGYLNVFSAKPIGFEVANILQLSWVTKF